MVFKVNISKQKLPEFKGNIPTLFKKHFGLDVKAAALEELIGGVDAKDVAFSGSRQKMVNGVSVDRYSAMGTPIFDYIKVKKGNYYNWNGALKTINEYQFPYECVVELNQPSIVEETYLKGRRSGSVKEIIGLDDFYITIRGFIINYKTNDYPTDAVKEFVKTISIPSELQVESPFLSLFNINEMVIFDRNIPQIEGALHYQPFTLMCKSNIPYNLEV